MGEEDGLIESSLHPFTHSPLHPLIFQGIAHVRRHATKDENLGAHASSGPPLEGKTGRQDACAPRDFRRGEMNMSLTQQFIK